MTCIETDRLILRPLRMEDAESMFEYAQDPEVTKYLPWDNHQSIADTRAYLELAIKEQQQTPLYPLAIVLKDNPDYVIGTVGIKTGSHNFEADLSYALSRTHWRQGIMFEASQVLMKVAFEQYGFKRIYAWCNKENAASSSLMKKLGMKFEGCLRSKSYLKGQFWDVEYYAILEDEWKLRVNFPQSQSALEYPITYIANPSPEDSATLHKGLTAYARQTKGMDPVECFGFFMKNEHGQVQAGCTGALVYGCVHTDSLWVSEHLRSKGIGSKLLQAAEQFAREKHCTFVTINTMDWEALELYKAWGIKLIWLGKAMPITRPCIF
jgi:ribosomal-protein-alanine N-acetyltransferase